MSLIRRFIREEEGLESVEWAVVGAVVTGITVAVITAIATNVAGRFTNLQNMTAVAP